MERPAVRCQDRFVHRLRERRMREDRIEQIFSRRFELLGYHETLDQLGDFRPDKMCTKEFPNLPVPDRLREAIGTAQRDSLPLSALPGCTCPDLYDRTTRLTPHQITTHHPDTGNEYTGACDLTNTQPD